MRRLEHEILVHAPLQEAWEAWTTAEGLRKWMAPQAEIELSIGGAYRTHFDPEAAVGDPGTVELEVLSFLPMEMYSYTGSAPPTFPTVRDSGKLWVVVLFREEESGVRIRLTVLGWEQGKEWDEAYEFFRGANAEILDRLKRALEEGPIDWSQSD